MAGSLSWLVLYGDLGYVLGSQGEVVIRVIAKYIGWLVGVILVVFAVYLLVHHLCQREQSDVVFTCAVERT